MSLKSTSDVARGTTRARVSRCASQQKEVDTVRGLFYFSTEIQPVGER